MSFDRLCDIHFLHGYYNDDKSKRFSLNLIPSIESEAQIRKRRITVRNNGRSFSLYGDIYTGNAGDSVTLSTEFKLSFAVVVKDDFFVNASDVLQSTIEPAPTTGRSLRQGNGRCVYYLHNNRSVLTDGKAYLSLGPVVGSDDWVPLRPTRFVQAQLVELSGIVVDSANLRSEADELDGIFTYSVVTNPAQPSEVERSLEVDLGPFDSGCYTFAYRFDPGTGTVDETASFYLDNRFAALRPFAVIDLFFYSDIAEEYRILDKDFYIAIGARKSTWRYNIISKYNVYEDKTIVSTPAGLFPAAGTKKILKNGETATVFESSAEMETCQISENEFELKGKHVETLGISASEPDPVSVHDAEEEAVDPVPATVTVICKLPTPKAENLVLETFKVGDEWKTKFFSDLFIYI